MISNQLSHSQDMTAAVDLTTGIPISKHEAAIALDNNGYCETISQNELSHLTHNSQHGHYPDPYKMPL